MSSTQRQMVTVRDLVDEVKKRIIILSICVVGLSYLMSLTSTTVWMNLPTAALLIILLRYFALDFEMRRKAAAYNSRSNTANNVIRDKPLEVPNTSVSKGSWKRKVNSPLVEDAIDHFTRHLVSEWVTDLWYSKLTPDRDGPEELVQIINGVLGEISYRMRHINLVDLLARDMIHLICKHLELFRACQVKIEKKNLGLLSFEQRDLQLKVMLAAENKLHPLMFSGESEHKVLQHVMDALVSLTFNPEDLSCSFFRYVARELLACAVFRPVVNLVNPRFINERVEQVAMSVRNASKGTPTNDAPSSKQNGHSTASSDDFSPFPDPSTTGVELVQLKNTQSKSTGNIHSGENVNAMNNSKDPLLAIDPRSTRSWDELPSGSLEASNNCIERSTSGGEWGDMLDYFSRRKTQALAPEHFENMWSKGRDYNTKNTHAGEPVIQSSVIKRSGVVSSNDIHRHKDSVTKLTSTERGAVRSGCNTRPQSETMYIHSDKNTPNPPPLTSDEDEEPHNVKAVEETESGSNSHISSDDEDSRITGLDSPTTKVWDGRTNRGSSGVSHIHHPLESLDGKRRSSRGQHRSLSRQQSGRKRSRLGSQKAPMWQEVERTSFLSVGGEEIHPLRQQVKDNNNNDSSDEYDLEIMGRLQSGATASSSASSLPGSFSPSVNSPQKAFLGDTFFTLRCEVVGANIVRSSSKTFAVYCISVIDADNNSWSIKRRYRHFEELHRRLKEYPEYSLHLPPKHFLSTGFDVHVIRERCKLLDEYLKKLMQLPRISGSIDVWDFLSIDSQTYTFSSAFSIVDTLSVDLVYKPHDGKPRKEYVEPVIRNSTSQANTSCTEGLNVDAKSSIKTPKKKPVEDLGKKGKEIEGGKKSLEPYLDVADDPTFPAEWVPPNLSGPILDLVDVVFQLQEGAWIRRKAFWVAKQVLQLGMGDALDDWLLEKIQRLHRGSVVASGIKRLEQILWPDGIFITKHPKRQRPPAGSGGPSQTSSKQPVGVSSPPQEDEFQKMVEQQEREAEERAKFVYELIMDNAPAAIVSLVGRKEYEQCARDLYFFLQSSVCLKQLIMDLLQLVLLHAFPELDQTLKQLREEKHKFGEFKPS